MVFHYSLSDIKYPLVAKTLHSILADPKNAIVRMVSILIFNYSIFSQTFGRKSPRFNDKSTELRLQNKWVRTRAALLHSLLDWCPWKRRETPYNPAMAYILLLFFNKDGWYIKKKPIVIYHLDLRWNRCWQIHPAEGKINKKIPETSIAWM